MKKINIRVFVYDLLIVILVPYLLFSAVLPWTLVGCISCFTSYGFPIALILGLITIIGVWIVNHLNNKKNPNQEWYYFLLYILIALIILLIVSYILLWILNALDGNPAQHPSLIEMVINDPFPALFSPPLN
jgi:hypothetical protein